MTDDLALGHQPDGRHDHRPDHEPDHESDRKPDQQPDEQERDAPSAAGSKLRPQRSPATGEPQD